MHFKYKTIDRLKVDESKQYTVWLQMYQTMDFPGGAVDKAP